MKRNLLKLILLLGILLHINSAFACWSSGWIVNCSAGSMNMVIKNDTNYILAYSYSNNATITTPKHIILPGGEYTANTDSGENGETDTSGFVYAGVSQDGTYSQIDSISASIKYHRDYVCDNQGNCGYNGQGYFHDFNSSHTWFVDNITGLSPSFMYNINVNIAPNETNNTFVYDYTIGSNNPSPLPPNAPNPWGNTDYAPTPYQNN